MQNHNSESNLRPAFVPRFYPHQPRPFTPRPPETILAEQQVIVERKNFHISKRENARGQFIVISEERAPHPNDPPGFRPKSNRVIFPTGGVEDFVKALQSVAAGNERPAGQ